MRDAMAYSYDGQKPGTILMKQLIHIVSSLWAG